MALPIPSSKSPSLNLNHPRILCLHGGGSNSKIFRISCRVLAAQLGHHARLVFADAPFFSPKGPLTPDAFAKHGPFRAWLPAELGIGPKNGKGQGLEPIFEDPADVGLVVDKVDQSLRTALEEDDQIGGTGPWIGLLGFSQGAKIAASLIFRQQHGYWHSPWLPTFLFGVLIAGPAPCVSLVPLPDHEVPLHSSSNKPLLEVPTIHVYGTRDCLITSPHEWLYQSCSPDTRKLLIWDGDHFVPTKSKDVATVVEMIKEVIKKFSN